MLGLEFHAFKAQTVQEIDTVFTSARQRVGALLVNADPFFTSQHGQFVRLAARPHHLLRAFVSDHPAVPIHGFHSYDWTGGSILHDGLLLSAGEEVLADWFRWRSFLGDVFDARQRSALWVVYGFLKADVVIILANATSLALQLAILQELRRKSPGH